MPEEEIEINNIVINPMKEHYIINTLGPGPCEYPHCSNPATRFIELFIGNIQFVTMLSCTIHAMDFNKKCWCATKEDADDPEFHLFECPLKNPNRLIEIDLSTVVAAAHVI